MLKQIGIGLAVGVVATLVALAIWEKVKQAKEKKALAAATPTK